MYESKEKSKEEPVSGKPVSDGKEGQRANEGSKPGLKGRWWERRGCMLSGGCWSEVLGHLGQMGCDTVSGSLQPRLACAGLDTCHGDVISKRKQSSGPLAAKDRE